jgi:twitching motility protein PilT
MPPPIRVSMAISVESNVPVDHKEVHSLIYEIMNDKQRKHYEEF